MPNRYCKFYRFALICAVILGVLSAACSTRNIKAPEVPDLQDQPKVSIDRVNLLQVSPEMRVFARNYGSSERSGESRAFSIVRAALDPYVLDFDYDPRRTLPAVEAFHAGAGNCLSFSSMIVALARDAGLQAWFQEVEIPPVWSAVNETMLFNKHVNAVVQDSKQQFTVDVSRRKTSPVERVRRLRDSEAEALYYNNLGVDALMEGDLPVAYAYFRMGLETEPSLADMWSNLGVVLRRNGQTEDALLAYRTSLLLEPQQSVALNNLYTIYTEEGDLEAAAELESRVERNRQKNPYYLHYLAEIATEEARYSDAIKLLERAIVIEGNEYRFYLALARSQFFAGKLEQAQTSLEAARRLAPPGLDGSVLTLPGGDF